MDKEARQAHGHNREQTPTTVRNIDDSLIDIDDSLIEIWVLS